MISSSLIKEWQAAPYRYADVERLTTELGVSKPFATVLARRGLDSPAAAEAFLTATVEHSPEQLSDLEGSLELVERALDQGLKITIYGDYDVDGVCSTSTMVSALRTLGGSVNWFIPSRFEGGYGLSVEAIEKLAAQGSEVVLAVDCGATAADVVARALELGLKMAIFDHHQPGETLPACPLVHPQLNGYPFDGLCATAVCFKFIQALMERRGSRLERPPLDWVALATVADVVPLIDENRTLVQRGLRLLRNDPGVGLRALAESAKLDLTTVTSHDIAFKLAPRINAAGRLYRADAGVELLLSEDYQQALTIASELDSANFERRQIEREVLAQAEKLCRAELKIDPDLPALVVAGEGWHGGVVGIVASRLMRKYGRPAVVVALPGSDDGSSASGSGRSIPGYDLVEGLSAASDYLLRFGGHKMAAGLELDSDKLDAFREQFLEHASSAISEEHLKATEHVDALVSAELLDLSLAEELERLEPFGSGNPPVNLLLPTAKVSDVEAIGDGSHARFKVLTGSTSARAVAFRCGGKLPVSDSGQDIAVKLERNHFNGAVEPQLILQSIYPEATAEDEHDFRPDSKWLLACLDSELGRDFTETNPGPLKSSERTMSLIDARDCRIPSYIAELISSGESVAVFCADLYRRRALLSGALSPARFGLEARIISKYSCAGDSSLERERSLAFIDYELLPSAPQAVTAATHIVLLDPPTSERALNQLLACNWGQEGFVHAIWSEMELEFSRSLLQHEYGLNSTLRDIYRILAQFTQLPAADELLGSLVIDGESLRSPQSVARSLRVFSELGLIEIARQPKLKFHAFRSTDSKVELEQSEAFRLYQSYCQEGLQFLDQMQKPRPL